MNHKKGFTLIQLLLVAALLAVLISIAVPGILSAVGRARAAADAANLQSVVGVLNSQLAVGNSDPEALAGSLVVPQSSSFPGADVHVLFANPGFIEIYYVSGSQYYGMKYFSLIAAGSASDAEAVDLSKPNTDGQWYIVEVAEADGGR